MVGAKAGLAELALDVALGTEKGGGERGHQLLGHVGLRAEASR
jgi:hypothetical protein